MKNFLRSAIFAIAVWTTGAHAAPVDVSYTVTGSANNWTYDFAFTNNLGDDWKLYFLGVSLPAPGTAVPNGALSNWNYQWSNSGIGGVSTTYNAIWYDGNYFDSIQAGATVHLLVTDWSSTSLFQVGWFAYAVSSAEPGSYDGGALYNGDHLSSDYNPGFEGVAAVPEPETYAMLLAGLGLIGAIVRRKHLAA